MTILPAAGFRPRRAGAVESVLGQSFDDLELIMVDNGSTDGREEILAGFRDPRLTVLQQPENGGYAPALNRALEVARGCFLARQVVRRSTSSPP